MQFASALSTHEELSAAVEEAATAARAQLDRVDVVFAFVSPAYGRPLALLPALLEDAFPGSAHRLGCTGGGIIGGFRELESRIGLSVLAAQLPNVTLHGGHVSAPDLPGPDAPPDHWARALGIPRSKEVKGIVVLTDPFHMPCHDLIVGLDYGWPGIAKVGGIASGSRNPEDHLLFHGRHAHAAGAVVVGFAGDIHLQPIVAQGCRPVGQPATVAQADASTLLRVSGNTALEYLNETLRELPEADQAKARQGNLFLGVAHDPLDMTAPGPGTFLIRQLVGLQPARGSLTIAGRPTIGSTVQFHLRDSAASSADLRTALAGVTPFGLGQEGPAGALMFSCLGRGEHLYGDPDHDSRIVRETVGDVPTSGFFCNGEIGPVGQQTHLHGFTNSLALFRGIGSS